jgi:cytidine deaminase
MVENQILMSAAVEAQQQAYAPYSKFRVGACVATPDGTLFTGCNVENASFGATNCAERTAIFKAVSQGYRTFDKIAIVGGDGSTKTYPCGICLQVLSEFMPKGTVVLQDAEGLSEYPVDTFLPMAFHL